MKKKSIFPQARRIRVCRGDAFENECTRIVVITVNGSRADVRDTERGRLRSVRVSRLQDIWRRLGVVETKSAQQNVDRALMARKERLR